MAKKTADPESYDRQSAAAMAMVNVRIKGGEMYPKTPKKTARKRPAK